MLGAIIVATMSMEEEPRAISRGASLGLTTKAAAARGAPSWRAR